MKMNYNDWFYRQYNYLPKGERSCGDNKWVNINQRYQRLLELQSTLFAEQPFSVVANKYGFDKLIRLMSKSNYTFGDLDHALVDTYRVSLKNAMGRMLVNTHATMFCCNLLDREYVAQDADSHYHIIDVPFDQLHFGERDTFIRQQLKEMYRTEANNFVPISRLNAETLSTLLGFSLICCVNGFITNDCYVAMDDRGFRFKIGWMYSSNATFLIYKLDTGGVYVGEVPATWLNWGKFPLHLLPGITDKIKPGNKCLVNLYDKDYVKTTSAVPNFGYVDDSYLQISNMQQRTKKDFERIHTKTVSVVVYELKYLHEVPDVYPAINYYDIMDTRKVYTDKDETVTNTNRQTITASDMDIVNELEKCTPPIMLDRPMNLSFDTICNCLKLYDDMMKWNDTFQQAGRILSSPNMNDTTFVMYVTGPLTRLYPKLLLCYQTYIQGSVLTSLVPVRLADKFKQFTVDVHNMMTSSRADAQKYTIDEYYGDSYQRFVEDVTSPFRDNALGNIKDLNQISVDYFPAETITPFNRPVAEQCFIAMKYDRYEECWLFDAPEIKHFHGIGNTFYVDADLKGDEVFKFFVLYTDTESPAETTVEPFDLQTTFDFDLFYQELEKHIGCIRYWYAENKLMKLSEILYSRYDIETCGQVLSKILKHKVDADDLIDAYPSSIDYEPSSVSQDAYQTYTEDSEQAPFAINFLFYTIGMLYQNEDRLQSYFLRKLTQDAFKPRYADVDVSSMLTPENATTSRVNYTQYAIAPSTINLATSVLPTEAQQCLFYGTPHCCDNTGGNVATTEYLYTFQVFRTVDKYYLMTENDIDENYYLLYPTFVGTGYQQFELYNDIYATKLMTFYLTYAYDFINNMETDYNVAFFQSDDVVCGREKINRVIQDLQTFALGKTFTHPDIATIVDSILTDNVLITKTIAIGNAFVDINKCYVENNKLSDITSFVNRVIMLLRRTYITIGFDNNAMKRVRALYLHLKKINTKMNLFTFKTWLQNIDLTMLQQLDYVLARNENFVASSTTFTTCYNYMNSYITRVIPAINACTQLIADLSGSIKTSHLDPIAELCVDVVNDYMFDLYRLDKISINTSALYAIKPVYIRFTIAKDAHFYPPIATPEVGNATLFFKPILEYVNNGYHIKSVVNVNEYAFFNGTPIQSCTMHILGEDYTEIGSQIVSISFKKVSSTGDHACDFDQLVSIKNTVLDFENRHETFSIANDNVITSERTKVNYELLLGNHYAQLDSIHEFILNTRENQTGPVDRIFLPNQLCNAFAADNFVPSSHTRMFFKPVQVMHLPIDDVDHNSIVSVKGRFFVGQTLYLETDDHLHVFPVIVTEIDHSLSRGFLEARVDDHNATWMETSDATAIEKYLTELVPCTVIDDNIRNFLDEYTNEHDMFSNVWFNTNQSPSDEDYPDAYSLPGDPIFVSNNTDFVYTRLNWFFNELVPNRFIDDDHKRYRFVYIDSGFIGDNTDTIQIKMVNHDFTEMTSPELYPILREEPNDHSVWKREAEVFENERYASEQVEVNLLGIIARLEVDLRNATTEAQRERIQDDIRHYRFKVEYEEAFQARMTSYILQLEPPTTWYNVRAYEDAMVYISNGRARTSVTFLKNVRDIPFTDSLKVYLYDWENKHWVDPALYTVTMNVEDYVSMDNKDGYATKNVLHSITITPAASFVPSCKLLVYFAYERSDVFDSISMNPNSVNVKFKPILSLSPAKMEYDPYGDIRIRKHFDGKEVYKFEDYNPPTGFPYEDTFYMNRIRTSEKYPDSPVFRMCDLTVTHDSVVYPYTDFDMYVKLPYPDITTDRTFQTPTYVATVTKPISGFVINKTVRLLCVQNTGMSRFDGCISNIMFEGITSLVGTTQTITIQSDTIPMNATGTFICTVQQESTHPMTGGVIQVVVTQAQQAESMVTSDGKWMRILDSEVKYHILPKEFILVKKESCALTITEDVYISLISQYEKLSADTINLTNDQTLFNPYEYYYDTSRQYRLPMSNIPMNKHQERFVVDQTEHAEVHVVKSTYANIVRYALEDIPADGFIDVTGFIPTPLSRNRYEFWVNGRFVLNDDVIILSPTTFQLINLRSLHNFELIELVDDMTDSVLLQKGNVYVNQKGKTFSTYNQALLSSSPITNQSIQFLYNADIHQSIHDYYGSIVPNPNNRDVEPNVFEGLIGDETGVTSYDQIYNVPTINGTQLHHPSLKDFHLQEIPSNDILNLFDQVWKLETSTNMLFKATHRDDSQTAVFINLRIQESLSGVVGEDYFVIVATGLTEKYFSLYITTDASAAIDDVATQQIIPYIKTGVYVVISKASYEGMWLKSTFPSNTLHLV